jgi:hypothetical protein
MRARTGFLVVFTVALAAASCQTRSLPGPESDADRIFAETATWPAFVVDETGGSQPTRALDILFMVDNSSSMTSMQAALAAGFTSFMNVIDSLPGGTPDLHIGVVSSDMGAGDGNSIAGCTVGGDNGVLQNTPRGGCTDTTLAPGARYITLGLDPVTGDRITNYGSSSLAQVFGCIAQLGAEGCGFEHQLSSVRHALDPKLAPPQNAGFLRPDAFLAVILLSNEDDCSAPAASPLFDPTSSMLMSKYGPTDNFVCNEFGHLCLVNGSLQAPSRYEAATYDGCVSNDHGMLDSVADFIATLRGLKSDPAKVFVATIAGPPTPYTVTLKAAPVADTGPWPFMAHSCGDPSAPDGIFADPAVRLNQVSQSLGAHGTFESICNGDMSGPLGDIATLMANPLGPACIPPPAAPGLGCTVVDRWTDGGGTHQATVLPACADPTATIPCWSLVDDAACGAGAQRLQVDRTGTTVPPGLMTAIDCTGQTLN